MGNIPQVEQRKCHCYLCINENILSSDEPCLDQGIERELGAGGVTSWVSQEPSTLHLLPGNLCQTVHRLLLELWSRMSMAVPFGIGIDILEPVGLKV